MNVDARRRRKRPLHSTRAWDTFGSSSVLAASDRTMVVHDAEDDGERLRGSGRNVGDTLMAEAPNFRAQGPSARSFVDLLEGSNRKAQGVHA